MSTIGRTGAALLVSGVLVLLMSAGRAEADHDRNRIEQLMAGAEGNPAIQFVELRMLGDFENCQGTAADNIFTPIGTCAASGPGASLLFFNQAGSLTAEFVFPSNTPVGLAGRSILIATAEFAALETTPTPDFIMPPHVVAHSGKVCYRSRPGTILFVNQCLSYGDFGGSTEDFGTPAPPLPITGTVSLKRVNGLNDNAADFALATPTPTNNATETGTVVAPPPPLPPPPLTLAAATLPASRSVQVGATATAFATVINAGSTPATGCGISLATNIPATFTFQRTDAANQVAGSVDTPVDIAAGGFQSFVIAVTPSAPISPTDLAFSFDCATTEPAPVNSGLNTLLLSASTTPVPDIVAIAVTVTQDGIVNISGATGTGVLGVATVNVGAGGSITASPDTGGAPLPVVLAICQTHPATSQCTSSIGPSVNTQINAGETPTFAIFVTGAGPVPFEPAGNRVFVRFRDAGGAVRGATSVAVRTQ